MLLFKLLFGIENSGLIKDFIWVTKDNKSIAMHQTFLCLMHLLVKSSSHSKNYQHTPWDQQS